MNLDRLNDGKRVYLKNFRLAVKAATGSFEPEHLLSPPEGVDLMEGTGLTADELLAFYRWESRQRLHYTSILHRAATAGLAVEYGMHEVNSECSNIGYALREVMSKLPEDSPERSRLEGALNGVTRFRTILSAMNKYSQSHLGSRGIEGKELIRQVNEVLGFALDRWKVTLTASDAFLGAKMPGFEKYSVPVFINLIRNAAYWTEQVDRERRIHLDASPVEMEPYDDGTPRLDWIISVSDSGPGVDPAMRETIFEPFQSGRGSSGVGLYLCRQALAGFRTAVIVSPEKSELGGAKFLVGPHSILAPAPSLTPSRKEALRVEAIGIAQLVIDGKTRELIELYGEQYSELSRESLRVRIEGPKDADDRLLLRLADGIEDVLRSRNTPEALQGMLDEDFMLDGAAPPSP